MQEHHHGHFHQITEWNIADCNHENYNNDFIFHLRYGVRKLVFHTPNFFWRESVALPVARRTDNRKVVGSRPTKVVCISVDR